ncbi:MAG TPA: hypothetical protein VKT21_06770 [Thermoplasmata archaeon]|nr:hypothetical protein [Thermoplasmata archaeon]
MNETPPDPFIPLPMVTPTGAPSAALSGSAPREVRVVYVRYRDPHPLEFPDRPERLPGPIFHAAGVLLREDDTFLALGEVAFAEENPPLARRYGVDLFPAYRNILTIPKTALVERRDVVVERAPTPGLPTEGGTGLGQT